MAHIQAASDPEGRILDHLHYLVDARESSSVRSVGVDSHTDARLRNLCNHIIDEFIVRNSDEHLRPVAGSVVESPVNLFLGFHVYRSENIALNAVGGTFCLEGIHLLLRGIQRQPPVLDREILDSHRRQILQRPVNVKPAVRESRDPDLEIL